MKNDEIAAIFCAIDSADSLAVTSTRLFPPSGFFFVFRGPRSNLEVVYVLCSRSSSHRATSIVSISHGGLMPDGLPSAAEILDCV